MDEIIDTLWISRIREVQSRETGRFDRVVSVCQDACPQNISDDTPYDHFQLADDEIAAKNWGGDCSYETFAAAARTVVDALDDGETVVVHCHAGQNRSAAVCAAALAVHQDSGYHDAFGAVGAARPVVNPNDRMKGFARRFIQEHQ